MEKAGTLPRFAIFFLCVFAFVIMASVLRQHPGFPLDDSWIHQTVARNLAEYGVLGYVPGVPSSGSSSLLWTLILTLKYRLLPGVSPMMYSAVINGLLLGAVGASLKLLTEQDGFTKTESWILSLAPLMNGNFLWLGMLGMEHVLFVALSIGTIACWFLPVERTTLRSALYAGALLGLLVLTRPEGIFLTGLLLLMTRQARRSYRDCAVLVSGAAMAQLISFRVNWVSSHTLLPLTMKGRQFLYFGSLHANRAQRLGLLWEWVRRIMKAWTLSEYVRHHPGLELLALASLLGLPLLVVEVAGMFRERRSRMCAVVLWAVGLDLLYFVVLPSTGHGGRYQSMHLLLLVPLMFAGLYRTLRWTARKMKMSEVVSYRLAAAAMGVLMVVSTAATIRVWRTVTGEGIDQINEEHGAMSAWLKSNLPATTLASGKIAVFDIGKIGYELDGRLVDLGGLTDAGYLPYLMNDRVTQYLQERQISYLVLPTDPSPEHFTKKLFRETKPPRMQELKTVCIPAALAAEVASASLAAAPCQSAYRLSFEPIR